jgi:hypothetical protein
MFYLTSQKALRPHTWWKEVPYLPLLLALGIGMSINNAKAVMEAIFNHETAFIRTPKYGIGQSRASGDWKRSSYKAMKTVTPIVELLFGFFFLFVVVDAAMNARWASAILLMPFPVGFFYTSLSSLARMLPDRKSAEHPAPAVPKGDVKP